VSNYPTCNVRV